MTSRQLSCVFAVTTVLEYIWKGISGRLRRIGVSLPADSQNIIENDLCAFVLFTVTMSSTERDSRTEHVMLNTSLSWTI